MLDKATLTLGDNRRVDLSQTVIFMTSNLGSTDITAELFSGGYGFVKSQDKPQADINQKVERTAVEAARRKFSPEFMNRIDKVVVFHPLDRDELQSVLDIELGMVQKRVLDTATGKFLFRVTDAGRNFLLQEGTDQRYGARHLKRAIERFLVYPLANLLATQQVRMGDLVRVDWDGIHKELTFVREREGALITPEPPAEDVTAATPGMDGLGKDTPLEAISEETARPAALPASTPAAARPGPYKVARKTPSSPRSLGFSLCSWFFLTLAPVSAGFQTCQHSWVPPRRGTIHRTPASLRASLFALSKKMTSHSERSPRGAESLFLRFLKKPQHPPTAPFCHPSLDTNCCSPLTLAHRRPPVSPMRHFR